jgi:hypothetical protein
MSNHRPENLAVVAELEASQKYPIHLGLPEWVDGFWASSENKRISFLQPAPILLNNWQDAYLAAIAEHFSYLNGLNPPDWTFDKTRFLLKPHFVGGMESFKAYLLVVSPPAFRKRLIFTEGQPFSRPHQGNPAHARL